MGHQVPTPLVPEADRVGCGYAYLTDYIHVDFNPDCLGCHIHNGGADD